MAGERFIDQYASALDVLTFNSKPIINQLTTMADENKAHATEIVEKIESRIKEVVSHSSAWTFVSFMLWENICVYLCLKMIVSTICVEIVIVTSKESIIKKSKTRKNIHLLDTYVLAPLGASRAEASIIIPAGLHFEECRK